MKINTPGQTIEMSFGELRDFLYEACWQNRDEYYSDEHNASVCEIQARKLLMDFLKKKSSDVQQPKPDTIRGRSGQLIAMDDCDS